MGEDLRDSAGGGRQRGRRGSEAEGKETILGMDGLLRKVEGGAKAKGARQKGARGYPPKREDQTNERLTIIGEYLDQVARGEHLRLAWRMDALVR